MDKDKNNYWHMRTPYDTSVLSKLGISQGQLSLRNLFQLHLNCFVGSTLAESCIYPMDTTRSSSFENFSAMFLRTFVFHSFRVVLYDIFRRSCIFIDDDRQEMIGIPSALMCSSVAGCVAQGIYDSIVMAKEHMEIKKPPSSFNLTSVLKSLQQRSGEVTKLRIYDLLPRCTYACLLTAGDVAAYDLCKRYLKKHLNLKQDLPLNLSSSLVAGLVASLLCHPADVIRLRMLHQPHDRKGQGLYYKGSLECLVKTIRWQGPLGLYKNFPACWLRLGSWSVVFWLTLEQLRIWEGETGF